MYIFLLVIHVIASFVLIFVILLQAGRGSGLSEMFGGSSTQTIFGTSATSFLKKATSVSAIVFLTTSLALAVFSSRRSASVMERVRTAPIEEKGPLPIDIPEEAPEAPIKQDDSGAQK